MPLDAVVPLDETIRKAIEQAKSAPASGTSRGRPSAPYKKRTFYEIVQQLERGVPKREIARNTGEDRRRIDKVAVYVWPPASGVVYEREPAPLDDTSVVLRRVR